MGASQSTRKLTIANEEEDTNVIRISDAVAKRLAQTANEPIVEPTPKQSRATVAHSSTATAAAPARAVMSQNMVETYYPPFTISALEMQQQKEKELAEQEAYWQQRLQNLDRTHEKINRAMDQEYKKALSIFDDCRVIKVQGVVQPCIENRQKVLKCYTDNPKETLRCADLVEEFSNCVDQRRAQLMKCN